MFDIVTLKDLSYSDLISKQTEICEAIDNVGLHKILGFKTSLDYLTQCFIAPKAPMVKRVEYASINKIVDCCVTNEALILSDWEEAKKVTPTRKRDTDLRSFGQHFKLKGGSISVELRLFVKSNKKE